MALNDVEKAILGRLPPDEDLVLELKALVEQSSHTPDREGVDRVGRACEAVLERCGFRVGVMITPVTGNWTPCTRRRARSATSTCRKATARPGPARAT